MAHYNALVLLTTLVSDIHTPLPNAKQSTKHRKAACHFRDNSLLSLFNLATTQLQNLSNSPSQNGDQTLKIIEATLTLIKACFTFDFIGTGSDEPADEIGTLQIPHSWKTSLLETPLFSLLFNLALNASPVTSMATDILSLSFSTRKSLFNQEERTQVIARIFEYSTALLRQSIASGLDMNEELSRLLIRVKSTYQTSDLTDSDNFDSFIRAVTEFCVATLQSEPEFTSIVYILTFWNKIALSIPSGSEKSETFKNLENACGLIVCTFLKVFVKREEVEEGEIQQVAELSSGIARVKYQQAVECVIQIFDQVGKTYVERKQGNQNVAICVYLMGSFIKAKPPFGVCFFLLCGDLIG